MKIPIKRDTLYVCTPYSGDIERNIQRTKAVCSVLSNLGYLPIAPHLFYTQFLNDRISEERKIGMECGLQQLHDAMAIVVVGDDEGKISRGMIQEIVFASYQQIQIIHFSTMDAFVNKARDIKDYLKVCPQFTGSIKEMELYIYVE